MSDRPRWWNCFTKLGYLPATQQIVAAFEDGSIYVYDDMTEEDYDRLRGTYVGIGKWFNEDLRWTITTGYHRSDKWPDTAESVVIFDEKLHLYRQIS